MRKMKTFEAFKMAHKDDKRIMQFPLDFQKDIFQKLDNQPDIIQSNIQKQKLTSTNSDQQFQKRNSQFDLFNSEFSESINQNSNDEGTSKFLTLKVANKLLGMMIVESSKGKRQPIIWAQDKKKNLKKFLINLMEAG